MKTLIIAAHPDDEVLGCGGTISRLTREGAEVSVAILGEGITSRDDNGGAADLLAALRNQSERAAKILGVEDIHRFQLPDNRFDTLPLLDIAKLIEKLIDEVTPSVIYTHHAGDLNIDHVITNRAVLTATRPVPGSFVKTIYGFEVPSSTEWAFQNNNVFCPNVFVDITATLENKLKAMREYESEIRDFPHPRSTEAIEAYARCRGSAAGLEAAEAFNLIRSVSGQPT